jgi:hypothetical protein
MFYSFLAEGEMAADKLFADLIQDIYEGKKTGALYVSTVEASEDLFRLYFKSGEIYHMRYGSASGSDCLDIIEYYTLHSATFFGGVRAPERIPSMDLPPTKIIITLLRGLNKMVKIR